MSKYLGISLICFLFFGSTIAQGIYGYDAFMGQLVKNHPVMDQADLTVNLSDANLRLQRGVNDPYISAGYADKAYDDKEYYEKTSFKVALPTSLGVELFAGYNENLGALVDPEISTSTTGQYMAGVSMPIGSRLLLNERQMAIRQGKIMVSMAEADRRAILNDLFFRGNLAYLNWSLAFEVLQVQENALRISIEQFEFIKETFLQGDRPAIDTTEAYLQVQNREFQLLAAENNVNTARLILSTFLWDEDGNALGLSEGIEPDPLLGLSERLTMIEDSILLWKEQLRDQHPDLINTRLDINALDVERQTAVSNILPQLEFKYAALTPGVSNRDIDALGLNDRMLGVGIKYPLLLRKERAKLGMVNIKTLQKRIDLDMKIIQLQRKLDQVAFDYAVSKDQAGLYREMTSNYSKLLEAEKTKFSIGESSVFLLNARENKLFDAQAKLLETQAKQAGSALKVIQTANRENTFLELIQ